MSWEKSFPPLPGHTPPYVKQEGWIRWFIKVPASHKIKRTWSAYLVQDTMMVVVKGVMVSTVPETLSTIAACSWQTEIDPIEPVPVLFFLPSISYSWTLLSPPVTLTSNGEAFETYSTICLLEPFTVLSAAWALAALIEKQAIKQWQINGVGREVVDFWQRGLLKPFVSSPKKIRSKMALCILNLR